MSLRTLHIITIVLALIATVYSVFFRDMFLYFLHGYDPSIIGSDTAQAYEAIQVTFPAKRLTYYATTVLTLIALLTSCLALYRREHLPFYLTHIAAVASLLLSVFYLVGLMIVSIAPRRTF